MEKFNKEIVIKSDKNFIYIALLENGKLMEFVKEANKKQFNVGDFYLGKVKRIMNGLNAVFIDIGYEKDAFLHYHDLGVNFVIYRKYIRTAINHPKNLIPLEQINIDTELNKYGKISDILVNGELLLVQISKEAINNKGPRLTAEVTIPGRYLVLVPFSNKVSVSQKIKSKEERERLRQIILSIKPNNFGVIVRTAAQGKGSAIFHSELLELRQRWEGIIQKLADVKQPQLIESEIDRISAYLRDVLNDTFNAIYVDDQNLYYEIKNYIKGIAPGSEKILRYYTEKSDIFEYFGIDKQIKRSFQKVVPLKKGGYLIIEKTEALYVIDVNSGNKTGAKLDQETNAFAVNLLAVEEIARQLRLRDMGGIIVIDFIDMYEQKHRDAIYQSMKKLMMADRAKHTILPLTKFGLMQITRQRIRPEIDIIHYEPCPVCNGTGQVGPTILLVDEIENKLQNIINSGYPFTKLILRVHPYIHAYLKRGLFSFVLKWIIKYKRRIKVIADKNYYFLEYAWFDSNSQKLQKQK